MLRRAEGGLTKSSNNTLATPSEHTVLAYAVDDEAYLATRDDDGINYRLDIGLPNSFVEGVDRDVLHVPSHDTDWMQTRVPPHARS